MRQIYDFSRENTALLAGLVDRCGSWWVASSPQEVQELEANRAALASVGVASELRTAAEACRALGATGLGPALFLPEDGRVQVEQAIAALEARAVAAGAEIRRSGQAAHVEAAVTVVAAGAWSSDVHPWFDGLVHGIREQVRVGTVSTRETGVFRAGQGYVFGAVRGGELRLGGARWATPHLEVGEREPVVVDVVQQKLDAFAKRAWPASEVASRHAYISAGTCDGLPLIGPIPGSPDIVACAGFGGNDWGLALRAARAVADGLLTGTSDGVPKLFRSSRMRRRG
jgi:glycine oxidase